MQSISKRRPYLLRSASCLRRDVTLRAVFEGGVHHSFSDHGSNYTERFSLTGKMRGFEVNGIGPRDYGIRSLKTGDKLTEHDFARNEDGKIWSHADGCVGEPSPDGTVTTVDSAMRGFGSDERSAWKLLCRRKV